MSGKGALVAELLGLAASGTFSPTYTLEGESSTLAFGNGCADDDFSDSDSLDFTHRTICFSLPHSSTWIYNYLLSGINISFFQSFFNLTKVLWWTQWTLLIKCTLHGIPHYHGVPLYDMILQPG